MTTSPTSLPGYYFLQLVSFGDVGCDASLTHSAAAAPPPGVGGAQFAVTLRHIVKVKINKRMDNWDKHMATFKTFRAKRPISASAFLDGLIKPCQAKVNTLWFFFFFSSLIGLHSSSPSSLRFTLCAGRLDSPAALLPPSVHTQLSPSLCRPVQCFFAPQPLPHHPPVPGGLANKNDWCH